MTTETKSRPHQKAPLAGIKVVDMSRILAGPFASQTLADLGAEVIKIEAPNGDDTRNWGPPFIERQTQGGDVEASAVYFHSANRGKMSVVCDFKNSEDLKKLKRLIADADIVIENYKVGGLAKFGLDYPTLSQQHPKLIYASITGFGLDGPRAEQTGYDFLMQGMTGIMDLTGPKDGEPQKIGVAWIDVFSGLYSVIAIQAALLERSASGKGQHIDIALFDVGLGVLANQAASALMSDKSPTRMGNAHPTIVPYQVFPTSDGHIIIACGNDRQFASLCDVLGMSDLCGDPAYSTNPARVKNRDALCQRIAEKTAEWTKEGLIEALNAANVPGGPINSVADALADPQTLARGMVIKPDGLASLRSPMKFSRSELALDKASPILGEGDWSFGGKG